MLVWSTAARPPTNTVGPTVNLPSQNPFLPSLPHCDRPLPAPAALFTVTKVLVERAETVRRKPGTSESCEHNGQETEQGWDRIS